MNSQLALSLANTNTRHGVARHQHMYKALAIANGPLDYKKFMTTSWLFNIRTEPVLISLHTSTPKEVREKTLNMMENIIKDALTQCLQDGADPDDYVHLFMDFEGMDFRFNFCPGGRRCITLGNVLGGNAIKDIVNAFAAKIQSGNDVVINNNSKLIVYTYHKPAGGSSRTRIHTASKEYFIKRSDGIISIKNTDDKMCMARAIMMSMKYPTLSKLEKAVYRKQKGAIKRDAELLHEQTGISAVRFCGLEEAKVFADFLNINLHIVDLSSYSWEFIFHSLKGTDDRVHVFILYISRHYHAIVDIRKIIRAFSKQNFTELCFSCFKAYDRRYEHSCGVTRNPRRYEIGGEILSFFPNKGDDTNEVFRYIQKPKQPKTNVRKIIYLDFETFVRGEHRIVPGKLEPLPDPYERPNKKYVPYTPYPYEHREYDTNEYRYVQRVNWCEAQYEDGTAFTFHCIDAVMEWLMLPEHNKAMVMCHCGGAFDFQILMEETLRPNRPWMVQGKIKAPLLRGNKIITADIINDIRLVDSYAFVTAALAKFPKMFDLDEGLAKGFFPHEFNRVENWGYVGPIPDARYYDPDRFSEAKRKEFYEWYDEKVANSYNFIFRKEMEKYCHMDVTLLREGMQKFRLLFLNLEDEKGYNIGVDPFNFLTIAATCFDGIYRTYFMPENTIGIVQHPGKDIYSVKQMVWLKHVQRTTPYLIQHAQNGGEALLFEGNNGRMYGVDGYCEATNTVYQFQGCFFHGCPKCYEPTKYNPFKTTTWVTADGIEKTRQVRMGELYAYTVTAKDKLKRKGYNFVEIWECEFNQLAKKWNLDLQNPEILHMAPLLPRDAYFGGRTNAVKLYYACEANERIHYIDATSMYPSVMSDENNFYPVGPPTVLKKDRDVFLPIDELMGLQKCRVVPPANLYHPLLPSRKDSGKILFSNEPMVGTWTSVELQKAVRLGYHITDIYEQHHFPRSSNDLFRDYITTFFNIKKQAKDSKNTGLASVAKLCLNSMYGKFGFNPSKQKTTKMVYDADELFKYMFGEYDEVLLNVVNEDVAYVSMSENDEYTEHNKSNVYVAAFITAYARLKLYNDTIEPLGRYVLYFDTDSCVYVSPTGEHLIELDPTGALGGWESEVPEEEYFTHFVSCGPKTYCLKSASGTQDVTKAKGFSLHYANSQIFNFETLRDQVLAKALNLEKELLVLHRDESIMTRDLFRILVSRNKGKQINMIYDKREILEPVFKQDGFLKMIDTLPFGFFEV
mmetsp:Transcript_12651/g.16301  ORF Transcript_12651/g.16301 Transcript_12651/m.16301 type:complete len:1243 (-) Transcript_12651:1394-5122(-)